MEQTPQQAIQQFIIRITDTTLSFALREANATDVSYEPYGLKAGMSIAANLREAFKTSDLLHQAGLKATVIIDSPVLLLPVDDFSEEEAVAQYKYIYPATGDKVIIKRILPLFKTVAVFSIAKDLRTVLYDHFEEVKAEPLMTRMWEFFLQRNGSGANKKLYAYFHEDKMELCSFIRNRFCFANTFEVKDFHDAIYFILGVWAQIGGRALSDDLYLAGKIAGREALTKEIKEYLHRVYYINPVADFKRAPVTQVLNIPFDTMLPFI